MSNSSSKKTVVVLGGGCSGIVVAQQLSAKLNHSTHDLILVESRPQNIWIIAGLRLVVSQDKGFPDTVVYPYDRLFRPGKGTVKHGRVVAINEGKGGNGGTLDFNDGEQLSYDVLVIATGSRWSGPLSFPEEKAEFRAHVDEWRDKFKNAKDITVVGGGAVGIELVGELRDEYPKKKLTLVHGQSSLFNEAYPDKFRKYIEQQVRDRDIELILDEYVDTFPESGSGDLVLRSGKTITTDLVVRATGPKPNTEFIAASLGGSALNDKKLVKVTSKLQLPDHPSIFAVCDVIDWPEQKQAAKGNQHAPVVVANVISYLADKPVVSEYKGMSEVMIVTNGKNAGAAYLPFFGGIVLGSWAARLIKSKNLFLGMFRSNMGYK